MTYQEIRALQSRSNPWMQSLSPEDFSRVMGQISGQPEAYKSGIDPSWLAQADYYLNKGIEATGLPEAAGQLGEQAFGSTGRQVFHGIPRAIANMAPLVAAEIATAGGATPFVAGAIGAGGMGAMQGLETWGATEKVLPTALSGGLAAFTPAIMGKASRGAIGLMKGPEDVAQASALRAMAAQGAPVAGELAARTTAATTPGQVLAGIGAGQAALTAAQTGGEAINIWADKDRHFSELADPAYWAAQALSQGVFGALDVARMPGQLRQANRMRGLIASPLEQPVHGPEYLPMHGPEDMPLYGPGEPPPMYGPEAPPPVYGPEDMPLYGPEMPPAVAPVPSGTAPRVEVAPPLMEPLLEPPVRARMPRAEVEAAVASDDPVAHAAAVRATVPPEAVAASMEAKMNGGLSQGEAALETTAEAKDAIQSKLTKEQQERAEAEANLGKFEMQNQANLAERKRLAETDPAIKEEVDFVEERQREFARVDRNAGSGRKADPVLSDYRKWVLDGAPKGRAGLAAKINATIKLAKIPREGTIAAEQVPLETVEHTLAATDEQRAEIAEEASQHAVPEPARSSAAVPEFMRMQHEGEESARRGGIWQKLMRVSQTDAEGIIGGLSAADTKSFIAQLDASPGGSDNPIGRALKSHLATAEPSVPRGTQPPVEPAVPEILQEAAAAPEAAPEAAPQRSTTFYGSRKDKQTIKWPSSDERWQAGVAWAKENLPGWKGTVGFKGDPTYDKAQSMKQQAHGKITDKIDRGEASRPSRDLQFWVGVHDYAMAEAAKASGEGAPEAAAKPEWKWGKQNLHDPASPKVLPKGATAIELENKLGDLNALADRYEALKGEAAKADLLSHQGWKSVDEVRAAIDYHRDRLSAARGEEPQFMRDPLAIGEEMAALANDPSPEAKARLDQLSLERANQTPDDKIGHAGTFFGKAMRMMGMSEQEIATRLPGIARLWTAIKELSGTDLAQLTSKGRQAYGLFVAGGHPLVMLSAEPRSSKLLGYTVAHELIGHGLWDAHARGVLDPKVSMQLDRTRKFVAGALPEDRALMLKWMTEGLPRDLQKSPELAAILSSAETVQSADEVLAHMNALAAIHMVEGKTSNLNGLVKYLPKPLSDFLVNAASWASKSVRALKMAFRGNKEMWDTLAGHEEAMRDVMRAGRETEADALRFKAFAQMQEPGGIMDIAKDPASAQDWFSTIFDTSELAGFGDQAAKFMMGPEMARNVMAEGKAVTGGLWRAGMSFPAWIAHMARPLTQGGAAEKINRFFADILPARERALATHQNRQADIMDGKRIGDSVAFGPKTITGQVYAAGAATIKAKDDIIRWVTETPERRAKTPYEHLVAGTPEVLDIFNRQIATKDQNNVKAHLAQLDKAARANVKSQRDLHHDNAVASVGADAIAGTDIRYETAHDFLRKYAEQSKAGQPIDYAAMVAEAVPVLGGTGDPARDLVRATKWVDSFKDHLELIDARTQLNMENIGYTSERRMGKFGITFTKDGKTGYLAAKTKEDRDQLMATLRREGAANVTEAGEKMSGITKGVASDIDKSLQAVVERETLKLQAKGRSQDEIDQLLDAMDLRPELSMIEAQRDPSSTHIKAKRAPGREYLDMTEQQWESHQEGFDRITMRIADNQVRGMKNDAAMAENPFARSILVGFANYKTPDTPTMRRINKFGYHMTLSGNIANMAYEAVQPITAFPYKLVDEGAGVVAAHKHIGNGYVQMFKAMWGSAKYLKTGKFDLSKLSPDHQAVLQEGIDNNSINAQGYKEFSGGSLESDTFRKGAVTMGRLDQAKAEPIAKLAKATGELMIRMHNVFTNLSTGVATLAAYDFQRARGLDHNAAMRATWPLVNEGMLRGGRESRAAGVYDVGSARPVSSMIMSLQGYSVGTLSQMATYLKKGISGAPGERTNAWKAAAGMITTQVALAGVMGLPGVGAALRILQKSTGFDAEEWLEKLSAMGDDPGTEAMMKTMAMRGFSHALGGPDVSQRFGVSSILGFNEFDGFNLANLFGPVGSYAKRGAGAIGDLARGELGSAAEAVSPVALKKTLQLWNQDWEFRSPENDELLIQNPTLGEKVSYALGWQPVKLNRARQVWAMQRRAKEAQSAEDTRTFDEIADDLVKGDAAPALAELRKRQQERGPSYNPRNDATKLADRVEKRAFQRDPGRGPDQVDENLLRAMGVFTPTKEVARAQLRDRVYRDLGLHGYDQTDFEKYRQVDVLRQRNPFLTTRQAHALMKNRGAMPPALQALLPQE
jgi:hypothetical protein